jgi:FixJ family two-component response regulator
VESKATVYIVDDDAAILHAVTELVELIDLDPRPFHSADEFLKAYRPTGPGCLVLDVRMPGMSGLELQRQLAAAGKPLPTIVITGHGDVRMAVEAMKLGALEFLEKPFRTQELCDNIQRAVRLDGQKWQSQKQRENADRRIQDLTPAERLVMELVAAGKTNKMIAEELGLSVRAIEDRRARMMKKLGVENRAQLIELVAAIGSR